MIIESYYPLQCTKPLPRNLMQSFPFLVGDWIRDNKEPRDWGPQTTLPEPVKHLQSAKWFTTKALAYRWLKEHFPAGWDYFQPIHIAIARGES